MAHGSDVIDRVPPDTGTGGGDGGWAWVVTARGQVEAQLVRGVLENAGVSPIMMDDANPSPGAWLFLSGDPNALVRIYVPRAQLEAARLALLETDHVAREPRTGTTPDATEPLRWGWLVAVALVIIVTLAVAYLNGLNTVL